MYKKNKLKDIKAVVFDLDGTLVNTTKLDIFIFNKLLQNKVKNIAKYFGPTLKEIFQLLLKEKKIKGNIYFYILAWHLLYKKYLQKQNLVKKETKETLKKLKNKYILGLITSSDKYVALNTLKENYSLFDVVITADDVKKGKPNIEPMILFLKKTNLKPKNIVYVGDNIKDILFAKNAKTKIIAKIDKLYSKKELDKYNPNFIIRNIKELKKIL